MSWMSAIEFKNIAAADFSSGVVFHSGYFFRSVCKILSILLLYLTVAWAVEIARGKLKIR